MNYDQRPDSTKANFPVKGTPYWLEVDPSILDRVPDSAFGYTPGEDRCPIAERILANEAFLTDEEIAELIKRHGHCTH